ncbi:hypothetical protein LMG2828_04735 [Achromobacter piechaudii]|uniref:hypothetical protein n=1 Tax=Achromobacter piechaudii TaxID=72556 RepID=UPI001465AD5B|nr:hypothetical protein [Achromobacter piechaudii]CAB3905672.1 hypothetical protein LMG2828_04735 [Achromobacter piechaudii]
MIITKTLGRYNFANTAEKQWCVQMHMPDKTMLSEKWDEDDEPDIEGVPPSQVLDMIEERLKSYWICTRREETLARIAAYREQADQLDDAWARRQIASYERMVDSLKSYLITESEAA